VNGQALVVDGGVVTTEFYIVRVGEHDMISKPRIQSTTKKFEEYVPIPELEPPLQNLRPMRVVNKSI
jgi:hypothetical protein